MKEKELRLALVCYGGISLAVYMHGITKEVWRLAGASRTFHAGEEEPTGSQAVYHALLQEIEEETGTRLRVLVDIITGASAGGINGVFLAQAISTGQSLEPLTELWFRDADIEQLIEPERAPSSRFTKAWALPLAWMAARRGGDKLDETVEAGTRDEVRAKLSTFIRSRWFEPPFGGHRFTNMMLDALKAMAASPGGHRLLPDGQPLDLFVTVTDFRGHPERLRLHSPAEVVETEHRLVVPFSDHGEPCTTLADPAELVFAARSTSSFPGAFPPFMVRELDEVLEQRGDAWPTRDAFLGRVLPRQHAANTAEQAVLIDGSVLANAPFRPAISALKERPSRRPVDRRFVYVDPYPGHKLGKAQSSAGMPGFFATILGAVSELPRAQPIRDNLEEIAERSRRIERMRAIVSGIRPEVERQVEELFGHTLFLDRPTTRRLSAWRQRAQRAAARAAGYGYAAYGHLKIAGVVEKITGLLYHAGGEPGPDRWERIRSDIADAVRRQGFDDMTPSFTGSASAATITFLRTYDLGFRIRRLRLMARRLGDLEGEHSDTEVSTLREAIYTGLATYLECERSDHHRHLHQQVRRSRGDAGPLLQALAESLDLKRRDDETEQRLATALSAVSRDIRRPMLLTYLGFPYFDVATLPLLQGEGLDEFDPIKVDRISPDDARSIRGGGAEATLKGIQFNTFGAFFSRAYRENDYLWGRLHGAERMIDIILSTLDAAQRLKPGRVAAIKRRAFCAILDEEEERLTAIPGLVDAIRTEVG